MFRHSFCSTTNREQFEISCKISQKNASVQIILEIIGSLDETKAFTANG